MSQSAPQTEIVGLFHTPETLERAISELASAGWDRAELSLLGRQDLLRHDSASEIAADPDTPHSAAVSKDDVRQMRTLTSGMAGVIAAFAAAGATIMTGGAALAAVVGAAVAGGGAAAGMEALGRSADKQRDQRLQEQIEQGGVLLWALLRRAEDEALARAVMARCGATEIEVVAVDDTPPQGSVLEPGRSEARQSRARPR